MKKSQIITILSIAAFMLFICAQVSAQDLYTKSGSDLTWQQVKDQKKIPSASGGLTGSDIDVNQDHPLISSSPYKDRAIQDNTAIHTIANSTVPRSNFNKWTRWYQEDGNTQVFRMFKGEINVGNDIYYKPRIEAELKSHSKGTKINNGAEWVEWSGTYTFVEPVQANIFQIWSNKDVVLMLNMENDGRVRLNPRDQSGFKTILQNGKDKSVHIRVRDYATKYEVFVDGKYFYGRNYASESERVAHFRWGIYASRNKGDFGGVPQDGMMFVTGAQRRYSNDPAGPTAPNAIGPDGYTYSVDEAGTVPISDIPYDVAYGQDGKYEYLPEQRQNVPCTNAAFGNDPASGVQKYCFIRESKAPYSGAPAAIPGTIEAENYDHGGAGRSYMDDDTENNGDVDFRKNNGVDIGVGANNTGYAIGWMREGEWLEYTIDVTQDGLYNFDFATASENGTGLLGIAIDGNTLLTGIKVPQTGGWDDYASFTQTANLTSGKHVLRFNVENGGFNLDKINISNNSLSTDDFTKRILTIYPNPSETGLFNLPNTMNFAVHAINGKLLFSGYSDQVDLSKFPKGIYILRVENAIAKLAK